jgi:hypothetical protein
VSAVIKKEIKLITVACNVNLVDPSNSREYYELFCASEIAELIKKW